MIIYRCKRLKARFKCSSLLAEVLRLQAMRLKNRETYERRYANRVLKDETMRIDGEIM